MRDAGYEMRDTGCEMTGYEIRDARCEAQDIPNPASRITSALCWFENENENKKGGNHMRNVRMVLSTAVLFLALVIASTAVAAQKATPSGKVTLESTSIAAGIGVSWGDGKLTFKGKTYPFSVDGLSLVNFGISKANAVGEVYNLTDPANFAGTYVAAEAGLTLAGGMGGMVLRNANGVILRLHSVSQGAQLQLGTSGLSIKMK
jgi:hypothetical protein